MKNKAFCEGFEDKEHIESHFKIKIPPTVEILFSFYSAGVWEGYAFVLFQDKNILYEVNGSPCSWQGLEGLWIPEETTKESILHRCENGRSLAKYAKEITGILDEYYK